MKRVALDISASAERVLDMLTDNVAVNRGVRFDEREGTPTASIRRAKNGRVRIRCRMVGGTSRDNGYIEGTFFYGRLREVEGVTRVRGTIVTEPVFHTAFFALLAYFIYTCFRVGGFSVVPVCLAVFIPLMMRREYRKQAYLLSYMHRAARRLEAGVVPRPAEGSRAPTEEP